jgi:hypothetical protein
VRPLDIVTTLASSRASKKLADLLIVTTFKEMEMGKKLKELAGGVSENQLASTVKESAQQIWLAGLGAFAKAQEEGGKVFDALVKEGESIQSKTRKITDERIAQVAGKACWHLGPPGAGVRGPCGARSG